MIKLSAKELRVSVPSKKDLKKIKKNPIFIIVDNVMDTYNIGGIFRLADAVSASKVYLCGQTETPPHTRIKKASINTTEWVAWSYALTAAEAIKELRIKNKDLIVVAIEQNKKSVPYTEIDYRFPLALIIGHESDGVSREALKLSDYIAEIPMWGINKSLNVIVSLGIVMFEAMKRMNL